MEGAGEGDPARGELLRLRAMFAGRRHPVTRDLYVPPDLVRVLRTLTREALEREGFDLDDPTSLERGAGRLAPATRAILDHDLSVWPPWYRTRRGAPREVADIVHATLEDLSRLGGPAPIPAAGAAALDPRQPRST